MRLFRQRTRYHTPTAHKLVDAIALASMGYDLDEVLAEAETLLTDENR